MESDPFLDTREKAEIVKKYSTVVWQSKDAVCWIMVNANGTININTPRPVDMAELRDIEYELMKIICPNETAKFGRFTSYAMRADGRLSTNI